MTLELTQIDLKGYGRFDSEPASFECLKYRLPAPWDYCYANGQVLLRIRHDGAGYLQVQPPHGPPLLGGPPLLFRDNGHVTPSMFTWIIPESSKGRQAFTNFWLPAIPSRSADAEPDEFRCRFTPAAAHYLVVQDDWTVGTQVWVPPSGAAMVMTVSLTNRARRRRSCTIMPVARPYLASLNQAAWDVAAWYQTVAFCRVAGSSAFWIQTGDAGGNPANRLHAGIISNLACDSFEVSMDCFVGAGEWGSPRAVWDASLVLTPKTGPGFAYGYAGADNAACGQPPVAAMAKKIALGRSETFEFTMVIGKLPDSSDGQLPSSSHLAELGKYLCASPRRRALVELQERYDRLFARRRISTPDADVGGISIRPTKRLQRRPCWDTYAEPVKVAGLWIAAKTRWGSNLPRFFERNLMNVNLTNMVLLLAIAFVAVSCTAGAAPAEGGSEPAIIPWPQTAVRAEGSLPLTAQSRIVAADKQLESLAKVFSQDILQLTGVELATAIGQANDGDMALELASDLKKEAAAVTVAQLARVRGGTYNAVADGTATLLQLLDSRQGKLSLPRITIQDEPFVMYRCLLVDVARQPHSIDTLKKIVVLCRFYKIRYLQLHLTDDQAFTFPSKAFPSLATPGQSYTLAELQDLEQFASLRGVNIVPELEVPGHSGKMRAVKPFAGPPQGVINIGSEECYAGLDTLVGEICDVFKSTPYFHMGGDECWLEGLGKTPEEQAYMKAHNVPYPDALYDHFIIRMNEIVRKHGKQTVLWEGFGGTGAPNCVIPDNILVLAWETMYQTPQSLLKNGYTIVNATWRPLYIVGDTTRNPKDIYDWNIYLWKNHWRFCPSYIPIQLEPTDKVVGGQMSSWEQTEDTEVPRIRYRLAAMSERIWNPSASKSYQDFFARLRKLDAKAGLLMTPIEVTAAGLTNPAADGYNHCENWHNQPLTLTLAPTIPGSRIFCTTDGRTPTTNSTAYSAPITLTAPKTVFRAAVFDAAGKPLGQSLWSVYQYFSVSGEVKAPDGVKFTRNDEAGTDVFETGATVTVTLSAAAQKGGTIRYSLADVLSEKSPQYSGPIEISKDTQLAAGYFDAAGKLVGQPYTRKFRVMTEFVRSLATDKPATSSLGDKDPENPGWVCDGIVFDRGFWSGGQPPGWWQVDLQKVHQIDKIQVVPYWDGGRYYQYVVELSTDGKIWKKVIDRTTQTEVGTEKGYTDTFAPAAGRYVRVTVTKNSVNFGIHLVDVRVFGK